MTAQASLWHRFQPVGWHCQGTSPKALALAVASRLTPTERVMAPNPGPERKRASVPKYAIDNPKSSIPGFFISFRLSDAASKEHGARL